ncbi:MAG: efflux RND transporter periplasmic adaptor subunit [Porticoccaceae bacterium]
MGVNRSNLIRAGAILLAGIVVSWLIIIAKPDPDVHPHEETPPHSADVVAVELESRAVVVNSQGTVTAKTAIEVTSQVSGQVVAVDEHFAAGGFFGAGEALLQLDPRDYETALDQAEAALADARNTLAQEQGQARQAKREWRDLGNEQANNLFLRKPQLAAAEARVGAAEAGVRQAQLNLERTAIRLPFAGRIVDINVNLGQYVSANTVVASVYDSAVMEVRLPLSAHEMQLLNLNANARGEALQPLQVKLRLESGETVQEWLGQVVRVESSVDIQSRLFYVVAEIRNAGVVEAVGSSGDEAAITTATSTAGLIPGVFVEAEISSNPYVKVAVLPREALYKSNQVMVLDEQNRLRLRTVEVLQADEQTLVVRGLQSGQWVLSHPPGFIEMGARYNPVPSAGGDAAQ